MSHLRLFIIPAWVDFGLIGVTLLAAVLRGAWRERAIALVWVFPNNVLPNLYREYVCVRSCFYGAPLRIIWVSLVSDAIMLAACVVLARRADRYWIIWAGAFALLAVLSDLLAILLPRLVTGFAYQSADEAWWILIGLATLWGCLGPRAAGFRARPAPT